MTWDLPSPHVARVRADADDIDGYGHVNNAVYVRWLDECAWSHSTALGLPPEVCSRLGRGMAVWRTQINYLKPAFAGDELEIGTWLLANDGRLRIERRFQIRRPADDETLLVALLHYVCIDLGSGRAVRMPPEFARQYQVRPEVAAAADENFQPGVERRTTPRRS
ncbi:MAG TPA: thioesterase family protein [Steroidobacteraceae bacterium]|nr:thioesterase family protein [Steroidobacteraceae bacterium]